MMDLLKEEIKYFLMHIPGSTIEFKNNDGRIEVLLRWKMPDQSLASYQVEFQQDLYQFNINAFFSDVAKIIAAAGNKCIDLKYGGKREYYLHLESLKK